MIALLTLMSHKHNWNRTRFVVIHEFRGFPKNIAAIIAGYTAKLTLLDWIDPKNLVVEGLFCNPKADEAGLLDWKNMPDLTALVWSTIPQVVKLLKLLKQTLRLVDICWSNPAILDSLREDDRNDMWICWKGLSRCQSEQALQLLLANQDKISWPEFSTNPFAMEWLREHPEKIVMSHIDANNRAIDMIIAKPTIDACMLCYNSHPLAIELLRKNQDKIHWRRFSQNPGIFEYVIDPCVLDALTEQY